MLTILALYHGYSGGDDALLLRHFAKAKALAEWLAATPGIVADMHAHLDRRRKKAEADLIGSQRGPVERVLFGFTDFFRSEYFRNVRRSLGLFFGAYVWYITNVNTYTPPDYDD